MLVGAVYRTPGVDCRNLSFLDEFFGITRKDSHKTLFIQKFFTKSIKVFNKLRFFFLIFKKP
jgi:hypothetical protein